jgi:molybdate transport system substrate-binding protein
LKVRAATGPLVAVALAFALPACGGDDGTDAGATRASRPTVVVFAASSLKKAFTEYAAQYKPARVRLSFAGSDDLAAQIRKGVPADVFASANSKLPDALYAEKLVERPATFAGNRLVIAVPAGESKVESLADLAKPGVTIAAGSESVPIGSYTRTVLAKLPAAQRGAILGNVRSNEPDVAGILGKLTQGAVDAGFVYITDVKGSGGKLRAVALPARLQPIVAYEIAIVNGTRRHDASSAFVDALLAKRGQDALRRAGFLPPPAPH